MGVDIKDTEFEEFKDVFDDYEVVRQLLNHFTQEEFIELIVDETNIKKCEFFKEFEQELLGEWRDERK